MYVIEKIERGRGLAKILIGVVSGIITGTGMGGGTILIALLTITQGIEQHIAQATNLVFFVPTSIVAIIMNIKNKNVDLKLASIISFFGIIGAVIGASIAMKVDVRMLKKLFGYFLALIGINEIYTIIKEYINSKKMEQ